MAPDPTSWRNVRKMGAMNGRDTDGSCQLMADVSEGIDEWNGRGGRTSIGRSPFTCSQVRTASGMMGPLPFTTSNSMLCEATQHSASGMARQRWGLSQHAPQRREGRQDVGEHDDAVRLEGTPRLHTGAGVIGAQIRFALCAVCKTHLQRQLNSNLRRLGPHAERVLVRVSGCACS